VGPAYCGHCGQAVDERRGPLAGLIGEFLSEWLSFDGPLPRTLAAIVRPGRLTVEYLAGRRARYVRPLRLYLVASLILFATAFDLGVPDVADVNLYVNGTLVTGPHVPGRLTLRMADTQSWLSRWIADRNPDRMAALTAQPPEALLHASFASIRRALPLGLILFLPMLALALKLLYARRGVLYVDHLVFAVHFQTSLFLILVLWWAIVWVTGLALVWVFIGYGLAGMFALLGYLPAALRRVYGQSRRVTALKTLGLLVAYLLLLDLIVGPVLIANLLLR
jgi:hypothetical protein